MTGGAESFDDYRLVRRLGRSGATFLARDGSLDRPVVLSFLPDGADARRRSLAVAGAFARAAHPNLGRVHYVHDRGARPYVVAAFVQGQRLAALGSPLLDARVLDIGRGLAGALAALHAVGAAHGDVRAERVVLSEEGAPRLVGLEHAHADADEATKLADVRMLLVLLRSIAAGELCERLSHLADVERGVATAGELRHALDTLARPTLAQEALPENPYRSLRAFEREHAAVFFGREREVAELVERLRGQPWLLIAGRSGAGKSSLVRAGVAPAIAGGALGERAVWDVAAMVPGAKPLDAMARALAPIFDRDHDELGAALRKDLALAGRLARARTDRGLLLVVDQLEEVMTVAPAGERDAFCDALERFGALAPGVRVVFTLRSDFLDRLVELGSFGGDLLRAAYEKRASFHLTDVVDRDQVRVLQPGDRAPLDTKARADLGRRGRARDLQRDDAIEDRVPRQPHVGRRSATEQALQAELADLPRGNPVLSHRAPRRSCGRPSVKRSPLGAPSGESRRDAAPVTRRRPRRAPRAPVVPPAAERPSDPCEPRPRPPRAGARGTLFRTT